MFLSPLWSFLRMVTILILALLLTVAVCLPAYLLILLKLLVPAWRRRLTPALTWLTGCWASGIVWIQSHLLPTRWEIEVVGDLSKEASCLVVANHQSWVDVLVLLQTLTGRVPFPRFFLKRQLLFMPLIGPVFWGLDYPALRRHSREFLARHPEQAGKDLRTVQRMCRRYRGLPVSIINFLEGTRVSSEKHARQESPYRHLLRPRAGGAAFALGAMEGTITRLVDLTIAYPRGVPGFLGYLRGDVPLIRVRARSMGIPSDLIVGDYAEDDAYRARFQEYVGKLWDEKDRALEEMLR